MRTQFRAVHGAHTPSASAVTSAAETALLFHVSMPPSPLEISAPRTGANRSDCGRTSTASPITSPVASRHRLTAQAPAITSSAAVGPSVMIAGVYGTSAGCSATARPAQSAAPGRARFTIAYVATPAAAPSRALSSIATTGCAPKIA
ncbi:MAG: hypothetical protein U0270_35930 [Labilithrix sp.]